MEKVIINSEMIIDNSSFIFCRGWRLVLSSIPALQNPASRSLSLFKNRVIRYGNEIVAFCMASL